jgi:hypothetical protein
VQARTSITFVSGRVRSGLGSCGGDCGAGKISVTSAYLPGAGQLRCGVPCFAGTGNAGAVGERMYLYRTNLGRMVQWGGWKTLGSGSWPCFWEAV